MGWSSFERRWDALSGNARGALWVILGALIGAGTAALVKALSADFHVFQLVFIRAVIGGVVILPFTLNAGLRTMLTQRVGMHLARGLVSVAGLVLFFYALKEIPLANVTALNFSKPMFQIVLAVFFLGELVRWRRWTATIVGFVGVLIVIRPGTEDFALGSLYALAAALFFAITQTIVKRLAATERPETITLYFSLVNVPVMLLPAILVWRWPGLEEWLLIGLLGVLATAGQTAWVRGLRAGEVTFVGPFEYIQLVWAGLLGYLLFFEVPGTWSWIGAAVIVASAVYMAYREAQLARAARKALAAKRT